MNFLNKDKRKNYLDRMLQDVERYYYEYHQVDTLYRNAYNQISDTSTPLEAVSHLIQVRNGIEISIEENNSERNTNIKKGIEIEGESEYYNRNRDYLLRIQNENDTYSNHLNVLGSIIKDAILNNYPVQLELRSKEENRKKLESEVKKGRPFDPDAPQEPIQEKVLELAELKEYQHENGTPKPTTIRDELLNNYSELVGELGERALYNRVKRALKNRDMH